MLFYSLGNKKENTDSSYFFHTYDALIPPLKTETKNFNYVYACIFMRGYLNVFSCQWMLEEGNGSLGVGGRSSWKLPNVGTGNQSLSC